MSGSSGGGWRDGKKSSSSKKTTSKSQSSASTARGWKSEKKATSSHQRKKSRKFLQPFVAGCFLIGLLGVAVWIWKIDPPVRTHFVLLNPLDGNERFFDEAELLFPKSNTDQVNLFALGKHSQSSSQSLEFVNDGVQSKKSNSLSDADVSIIFLKAVTVPGQEQDHYVLLKNSTPNLGAGNEYKSLSILKKQLDLLPEGQTKMLLVDVNSMAADWRAGYFSDSVHHKFIEWSKEIPNLTVILSCDVGEKSWPSGRPGWGGTVFEMVLEKALSKAADENGNDELTRDEFFHYLSRETNQWVIANRSAEGQHVQMYPPLDQSDGKKPKKPLVLMKSLPAAPLRQFEPQLSKDLAGRFQKMWNNARELTAGTHSLSNPVLLGAALSQLLAAERNMHAGRMKVAENLLKHAEKHYTAIGTNNREDLTLGLLDTLLEHSEINDWLTASHSNAVENEGLPAQSAARVIEANLLDFPFESTVGSEPEKRIQRNVIATRNRMEKTAALMFHDAHQLRSVVERMQKDLLLAEDLLFLNRSHFPADVNMPEIQDLLQRVTESADQVEEYVLLKIEIERLQARMFQALPEFAEWAATYHESSFQTKLLNALQSKKKTLPPSGVSPSEELPFVIANTMLASEKLLIEYLHQFDSEFKKVSEVTDATKSLRLKYDSCEKSWQEANDLAKKICLEASANNLPTQQWSQSRHATMLPIYDENIRAKLLDAGRLPWSTGKAQKTDSPSAATLTPEKQFQHYRDSAVWEIAWRLRLQDLMQLTLSDSGDAASSHTQSFWNDWKLLVKAKTVQEVHDQLSNLGDGTRLHWQTCRDQILSAQPDSVRDLNKYRKRLLKADLTARFLRSDDLDLWTYQRKNLAAFERVNQLDYFLLLADLATQSQWTLPSENPVNDKNKWYVQRANAWLDRAEILTSKAPILATEDVKEAIQTRRTAFTQTDNWNWKGFDQKFPSSSRFPEQENYLEFQSKLLFAGKRPKTGIASFTFIREKPQQGLPEILKFPENGIPVRLDQAEQNLEFHIERRTTPDAESCSEVQVTPQLFFRGRTLSRPPFTVNPCPASRRTWQYLAGSQSAKIQVKGSDNRPIMFVLDWSFSMNAKDGNGKPKGRHEAAVNAINKIISNLSPSRRVGLMVFGHYCRENGDTNGDFEEQFKDIIEIKKRHSLDDVDTLHEIDSLENGRAQLIKKLRRLKKVPPFSVTPMGLAVKRAANKFESDKDGGLVILITDGIPTDLGNVKDSISDDATDEQKRKRKDFMDGRFVDLKEALTPTSISCVMLALDISKGDLTKLNCIFGETVSSGDCSFMGANEPLDIPIIRTRGEGDIGGIELREAINKQLEPRSFQVLRKNGDVFKTEQLKDSTIPVEAGKSYQIKLDDIVLEDFYVGPGDTVSVEMNWSKRWFDVKRDLHSRQSASVKVNPQSNLDAPDILRVNKVKTPNVDENSKTYQSIEIDVMLDHGEENRPVKKPAEIWFTFSAPGDDSFRPDSVQQVYTSESGAPGWRFNISPWPTNRAVDVNAFWKMERTQPDQVISIADLDKATSRADAIVLGGGDSAFPLFKIWKKLRNDPGHQIFEIRIEPQQKEDKEDFESLIDITVELGKTSILNDRRSFQPDVVSLLKTIVDSGVIVHAFEYPAGSEDLKDHVVAFTTLASRKQNALHLQNSIQVLK